MRNNHINTAVKALKKQREKFVIERDKAYTAEDQARMSKIFFEQEIEKLDKQIKQLEKPADTEADKVLKALEG